MAATIGDVAARAGVSVATVSRALRGLPNVAPSTRDRVLAAAAELHYIADPHASRLAAGKTRTVGIVVPLFTQWFITQVVSGAEALLAASGYDVLLYNVGGPARRDRFMADLPFRKRVDGLIVVDVPLAEHQEATLAALRLPIAVVGTASTRFPSVTIDNLAAARTATRHLVNLGHEWIGLIAGLADDPLPWPAPLERRAGYQEVLVESGLDLRADLEVPGNFSMAGGAEAMAQLLSIDRPPTGVFAESDEMAVGALKTLRDAGLRVPEDVSIVGFDDHEVAEHLGLTTIQQPVSEQGEVAAGLLIDVLQGHLPATPPCVVLPTKLVVRATTAPRRAPRRAVS